MQNIKSFTAVSLAAILAYFQPIHSVLVSITCLFLINFIFGLVTGIATNKERFNFRKAFDCISEISVFLVILSVIFFIGDHLGANGEAMQAVSTITYTLIYFYSVNILRNLQLLLPWSKSIAALHKIFSIEVLPRISRFLSKEDIPSSMGKSHRV